jgi:hypothetical protein
MIILKVGGTAIMGSWDADKKHVLNKNALPVDTSIMNKILT